ncbi:hypothetical protein [Methanobrevibacter arboriphilus]|uniref:hypothetical protein n=1 Tax=Methanobrevibacter arboriphilus TaxID=39441 RepID=UPI000AA1831A|nr:hypothetical protein [Methanobrevibacter arboriphilus]
MFRDNFRKCEKKEINSPNAAPEIILAMPFAMRGGLLVLIPSPASLNPSFKLEAAALKKI